MARKISVEIVGDASKLQRSYQSASVATGKFGKSFVGLKTGALAAVAGLTTVGFAVKGFLDKGTESEVVTRKMKAQLDALGISYNQHADQIDKVIQKHSLLTGIDDEDLTDAFTRIVRVTGDVNKALKLNSLAADIARARNMSLGTAAELVGKVYAGKLGILSRYGIVLDKNATSTEALTELERRFKGQAEASATGQEKLAVAWENVQESLGKKLLPTFERFANWLAKNMPEIQKQVGDVAERISETLGPSVKTLAEGFRAIAPIIEKLLPVLAALADFLITNIFAPVKVVSDLLRGDWTGAWEAAKEPVQKFVDLINQVLGPAFALIGKWINDLVGWFTALPGRIAGTFASLTSTAVEPFKELFRVAKQFVSDRIDDVVSFFTALPGRIAATLANLVSSALSPFQDKFTDAKKWVGEQLDDIFDFFKKLPGRIAGTVNGLVTSGLAPFQTAFETTSGAVKRALGLITDAIDNVKEGVKWLGNVAGTIIDRAVAPFQTVGQALADALGPVIWALERIKDLVGWLSAIWNSLPFVGGGGPNLTQPGGGMVGPPKGASGAIVRRPTFALIGEAGPEAVVPLSRTAGSSPLPAFAGGDGGGIAVLTHLHIDGQKFAEVMTNGQRVQARRGVSSPWG